jgi:hypothetical protein
MKKRVSTNFVIQSETTNPDRACNSLASSASFCHFYIKIQCSKKYIQMVELNIGFVANVCISCVKTARKPIISMRRGFLMPMFRDNISSLT